MTLGVATRVVRSQARIAASADRIARCHDLLRIWRQRHPMIAGAADNETIRLCVRRALREGRLTRIIGMRTWAGYGSAKPCHVCGEVIHRREIEHEVVDTGGPVLVHATCLRIWREESLALVSPR